VIVARAARPAAAPALRVPDRPGLARSGRRGSPG
jgi:hypothetical protein